MTYKNTKYFAAVLLLMTLVRPCAAAMKLQEYLNATKHLDFRQAVFERTITEIGIRNDMTPAAKLEAIFYFVRDRIPFAFDASAVRFKASEILQDRKGFCYQKAMVYVSLARRLGIPARLALERFYISKHLPDAYLHYHGIATVYFNSRWVYLDTVSNDDVWKNFWTKQKPAPFQAPRFTLDGNVTVDSSFVSSLTIEDYDTNDVPSDWLRQMTEYQRTGKWPD